MRIRFKLATLAFAALALAGCATWHSMMRSPGFFITSANPGKGGDLGGIAGADAYCQSLATSAGYGNRTWRAYLSSAQPRVDARDRIGSGPWFNVKGEMVAQDLAQLHGQNSLNKTTGLTEKGTVVNGVGDTPLMHDVMTGSNADGTLAPGDTTCRNWTSGDAGTAMVGHHDRNGTNPDPVKNVSWNSSHPTRGCSLPALAQSGSAGLFYCFAAN